ncbi:DUF4062 domain-containing protein [Phocaeicola salanitronis]|uniref:DUF4062 domain-containing protein n=1 Tax=Phocaeicola salanitronis TaxID=376805 RepID=UPI00320AE359
MDDKIYQVFISSTWEDLIDERKMIEHYLLKENYIPCGMEYFNASGNTSWETIRMRLDLCDYLVLIIAGRYGSVDEKTGLSYTEMEYNYARKKGIKVLPFIYKDISALPASKVDMDPELQQKRNDFIEKVKSFSNCIFWNNSDQLVLNIITSLHVVCKTYPATGWIRSDKTRLASEEWIKVDRQLDFDLLNDKLAKAHDACVYALGCTATTQQLCDKLINKKIRGTNRLRIIYMDPRGKAVHLAAKRQGSSDIKVKEMYHNNLAPLLSLSSRLPKRLQVRVMDFLPPYNLFIFNPSTPEAEIFLHLSSWQTDSRIGRPLLRILKKDNPSLFSYYKTEFERLWNVAYPFINKRSATSGIL